jgi:hypothetical protein
MISHASKHSRGLSQKPQLRSILTQWLGFSSFSVPLMTPWLSLVTTNPVPPEWQKGKHSRLHPGNLSQEKEEEARLQERKSLCDFS